MREAVLELWIACHMPRGQYIVIYERKGPRAQRAKRALRREARLAARLAASNHQNPLYRSVRGRVVLETHPFQRRPCCVPALEASF